MKLYGAVRNRAEKAAEGPGRGTGKRSNSCERGAGVTKSTAAGGVSTRKRTAEQAAIPIEEEKWDVIDDLTQDAAETTAIRAAEEKK